MDKKQDKWPLWKALWLVAVPVSVGYQLLWQWLFTRLFADSWSSVLFDRLALGKSVSELLLYSLLWGTLWRYRQAGRQIGWALVCLLMVALLMATAHGILLQLKWIL